MEKRYSRVLVPKDSVRSTQQCVGISIYFRFVDCTEHFFSIYFCGSTDCNSIAVLYRGRRIYYGARQFSWNINQLNRCI